MWASPQDKSAVLNFTHRTAMPMPQEVTAFHPTTAVVSRAQQMESVGYLLCHDDNPHFRDLQTVLRVTSSKRIDLKSKVYPHRTTYSTTDATNTTTTTVGDFSSALPSGIKEPSSGVVITNGKLNSGKQPQQQGNSSASTFNGGFTTSLPSAGSSTVAATTFGQDPFADPFTTSSSSSSVAKGTTTFENDPFAAATTNTYPTTMTTPTANANATTAKNSNMSSLIISCSAVENLFSMEKGGVFNKYELVGTFIVSSATSYAATGSFSVPLETADDVLMEVKISDPQRTAKSINPSVAVVVKLPSTFQPDATQEWQQIIIGIVGSRLSKSMQSSDSAAIALPLLRYLPRDDYQTPIVKARSHLSAVATPDGLSVAALKLMVQIDVNPTCSQIVSDVALDISVAAVDRELGIESVQAGAASRSGEFNAAKKIMKWAVLGSIGGTTAESRRLRVEAIITLRSAVTITAAANATDDSFTATATANSSQQITSEAFKAKLQQYSLPMIVKGCYHDAISNIDFTCSPINSTDIQLTKAATATTVAAGADEFVPTVAAVQEIAAGASGATTFVPTTATTTAGSWQINGNIPVKKVTKFECRFI